MANRHKMQARARGGHVEPPSEIYAGKGSNVEKEAREKKRGGAVVGRAFGGMVKGRADKRKRGGAVSKGFAFASGGKVWSKARGGIGGAKGMAEEVMKPHKMHDEMHDHTVKAANDGAHARTGHSGKARHQLATGGRVGYEEGGRAEHKKKKEEEEEGEDDDEDDDGFSYGGIVTYKRGGGLKMHYVGGKGKSRHRHAEGGPVDKEPDADADDRPVMAKGGGCWMAKAFAGSHGQFKAKAKHAGMSTAKYASKEAASPEASTKTKRQANLAKLGAKYGGG